MPPPSRLGSECSPNAAGRKPSPATIRRHPTLIAQLLALLMRIPALECGQKDYYLTISAGAIKIEMTEVTLAPLPSVSLRAKRIVKRSAQSRNLVFATEY